MLAAPRPVEMFDVVEVQEWVTDRAIARAIGEELRYTREVRDLSRRQLVQKLPSAIGDRTLLSYEHGTRNLTVVRLIELCRPLRVAAPTLLTYSLQRAQIYLCQLTLRVDLRRMLNDTDERFRSMSQWARNKLNKNPGGIVEVAPAAVQELAEFIGCTHRELARHMTRFTPEPGQEVSTGP
jgi:transcriptional regulator with XRE-family HTH domain